MAILLLGKDGQIGWELQRTLRPLGELVCWGREQADLTKPQELRSLIRELNPDTIVNAAAHTAVDKAESNEELAHLINAQAVGTLAQEAKASGALLIHYSTDYVFDGRKDLAYTESDPPQPLNAYGRSKLEGERLIKESDCAHLIFRASWVFSNRGSNFVKTILKQALSRNALRVVNDQIGAPTSAAMVANATAHALSVVRGMNTNQPLASDHAMIPDQASSSVQAMTSGQRSEATRRAQPTRGPGQTPGAGPVQRFHVLNNLDLLGTYHMTASGETTWFEFARFILDYAEKRGLALQCSAAEVQAVTSRDYPTAAARPANSRLDTTKIKTCLGVQLPDWRVDARRVIDELIESPFELAAKT